MKPPAEILLGDFARAAVRLDPVDAEAVQAVAAMLGLDHDVRVEPKARRRGRSVAARATLSGAAALSATGDVSTSPSTLDLDELPLLPEIGPRRASANVPWTQAASLPPVVERHVYESLPYESLFDPRWTRELLFAAVATDVASDELDVEAAVDRIAAGRPVDELPRRRRRSASFGVQLLIDGGPGMQPFRGDCVALTEELRRVAGRSLVHVLYFETTLDEGVGEEPSGERWLYQPPESGTRVLILSDLGLNARPARVNVDEWIDLARRLEQRGSSLVALVPYPERRWPPELARAVDLVQWDRGTTVAAIRRVV